MKEVLNSPPEGGSTRCSLEWRGGTNGDVVFAPNPNGKFLVNTQYLPK